MVWHVGKLNRSPGALKFFAFFTAGKNGKWYQGRKSGGTAVSRGPSSSNQCKENLQKLDKESGRSIKIV
jgi:hypothetical protein